MSPRSRIVNDLIFPLDAIRSGEWAKIRYLKEFEKTQYASLEELSEIRLTRLKVLLEHAYRECPFYTEAFDRHKVSPKDLNSLEDLSRFPGVTKQEIQANKEAMVAKNWPEEDLVGDLTGGSTGTPLSFYYSRDRKYSRAAATIRHNRWAGWDVPDRAAILWGAASDIPPKPPLKSRVRQMFLDQHLLLNAGHLTEERMASFHRKIKDFKPKVFLAYANVMTLFAKFLKAQGGEVYRPESIITSAEVLEEKDRKLIEEVFGCPVFNRYGCREVSVIASECDRHTGLHVMAEGIFVEVLGAKEGESGTQGPLLITDLMNHAMPLIRYRIGDVGEWESGTCECGRALPRLKKLAGRVTDFLLGMDGRLVSGAALTIAVVAKRPSLGQIQIIQDKKGWLHFNINPGDGFDFDSDTAYLREAAEHHLGKGMQSEFEVVNEIPRTKSGKFLFSKSSLVLDQF